MASSNSPVTTMRHAHVLTGIQTAKDANNPYREGLWTVVLYSAQVRAYQLPQLKNPKEWPGGDSAYQKANVAWATTTGTLSAWANSTLRNLIGLPKQLINASTQNIVPELNAAISFCQMLIQNPDNKGARSHLIENLQLVHASFGKYDSQILALIQSLQDQAGVFNADAKVMSTLADNALQTAGSEKQLIEKLNKQIDTLNSNITSTAILVAGGSFAAVVGIGLGILAILLAPFSGGVSLFLLVPAVLVTGVSAYTIALNSTKIVQDKNAIEEANKQISGAAGDIVLLNAMATTLKGFSSQVDALKSALNAIRVPWQKAEEYLKNTINEINAIQTATSENWTQVNTELNDILDGWNSLMVVMNKLDEDATVAPNSNLQLGMSEAEVKLAMNSAAKVSLIHYLSQAA